jgi:hypothetical protein
MKETAMPATYDRDELAVEIRAQDVRDTRMEAALEHLRNCIGAVEGGFSQLRNRLHPVLRPEGPEEGAEDNRRSEVQAVSTSAPLVVSIGAEARRMHTLGEAIQDVLQRLDV